MGKLSKNFFSILVSAILLVPMIAPIQNVHALSNNAIIFVGSASSNTTNVNDILTVNYASSAGDFIMVSVQNSPYCPAKSVSDTGGSVYSLLVNNTIGGGGSYLEIWGTTGTGSRASTSITVTLDSFSADCTSYPWNTFNSVIVAEYAGASDTLGPTMKAVGASVGSVAATCSSKGVNGNDWLVSGFAISRWATVTTNKGTLRDASFSGFQQGAIVDGKGASTVNVHHYALGLSDANSGILWYCGAVELRSR